MDGTTLCPHCNTRFRISGEQLEAHHGMVRCGHCMQAFDARPGFIPDEPSPQLDLPMLNEPAPQPEQPIEETPAIEEKIPDEVDELLNATGIPEPEQHGIAVNHSAEPTPEEIAEATAAPMEAANHETMDFLETVTAAQSEVQPDTMSFGHAEEAPKTLAEEVAIIEDETEEESPPLKKRIWPWAAASALLTFVLLMQAAYFFRVELAARMPGLKPALVALCQPFRCEVPLPRNTELMGIESSELEADPAHQNIITLHALLRNRATYAQAFPSLELTLNDIDDKPLARRVFRPADYLPPVEKEQNGLLPNHELAVKLRLDVTDLKPTGYRLVLFYPQ
jgi:predicted Zn finger-like uncharacterized protein